MNPEEHLARLQQDEVWDLPTPDRHSTDAAEAHRSVSRDRRPIWATVVVAAAVVAVAGVAISVAPSRTGGPAGPAEPVATTQPKPVASPVPSTAHASSTAKPTPAPGTAHPVTPERSAATPVAPSSPASPVAPSGGPSQAASAKAVAVQRTTTHGSLPAYAFVADDSADVARGHRAVACLHAKGIRFVDLAAADDEGIRYLAFGGADNDARSISLGLQYADACIAAAGH